MQTPRKRPAGRPRPLPAPPPLSRVLPAAAGLALALLSLAGLPPAVPPAAGQTPPRAARGEDLARIRRVVDGDTAVTEDGRRVRYIGIDAPEVHHPRRPPGCLGREASRFNRRLVEGKIVRLVRDTRERDRYGRQLRYLFLPGGGGRPALFVNEAIVAEGLARVRIYPPDDREAARLRAAERRAMAARRGIWALPPRRPSGRLRNLVLADPRTGRFHRPGTRGYESLRCRRGTRVFLSAEKAARAGFREFGKKPLADEP